jgi:hypothetical protein
VGRAYTDALNVNAEMVRQGAAWVYRKYNRDPSLLLLEREARSARRGLWALPETERIPPWELRAAASRRTSTCLPPGDRLVSLHRGGLGLSVSSLVRANLSAADGTARLAA